MYSQMVYGGPPVKLRYYGIDTHRYIRGDFEVLSDREERMNMILALLGLPIVIVYYLSY